MDKTILYVGGFILPDGNAAANRVLANSKLFREIGYNTIFLGVTENKSCQKILNEKYFEGFRVFEKTYPKSITQWFDYLTSLKDIKAVLNKTGGQQIVAVVAYNLPSIVLLRLSILCYRKGLKLIVDVTEWYKVAKGGAFFKLIKNIDSQFRMRILHHKLPNGIISISHFLYNYYKDNPNNVLLPPLIDPKEAKWPTKVPTVCKQRIITAIGIPNKNKESLSEILKALSNLVGELSFKLKIMGLDRNKLLEVEPDSYVWLDKLANHVEFLGRVSNEECIRQISNSHFFVFMRYNSIVTTAGFPTKFVESISCGTPVLTNRTGDIDQFLIEGRNGFLLDSQDTNINTEVFRKALNLPFDEINAMKKYCFDSGTFHYSNFVNEFYNFINKVLST